MKHVGLSLLLVVCFITVACEAAGSSKGDQHPWFQRCLRNCVLARNCTDADNVFGVYLEKELPLILHLTQWDCESDCKYLCMRQHNEMRIEEKLPIVQYYGKWPFIRVFGFQEIVSSLFSLGNFIPYCWGFFEYLRKVPTTYHMKPIFLAYAICGCFTWFFSFIFHCRDTETTEFLDYLFASFTYFFGSFWTTVRIFEVQNWKYQTLIFLFFLGWCIQHWNYMLNITFDYDYNIMIGVVNGLYQTLLWFWWYYSKGRDPGRGTYPKRVVLGYICLWIAGTMELFDFPPILELIDPHSLWHFGTIPLAYLMWTFLILDSNFEDNEIRMKKYHLG